MLGKTWADSYIAARHRRPAGDSPVRHMQSTCLGESLPYLVPQTPPSPLRIRLCLYNIPYCSIIELPIHISPHNFRHLKVYYKFNFTSFPFILYFCFYLLSYRSRVFQCSSLTKILTLWYFTVQYIVKPFKEAMVLPT